MAFPVDTSTLFIVVNQAEINPANIGESVNLPSYGFDADAFTKIEDALSLLDALENQKPEGLTVDLQVYKCVHMNQDEIDDALIEERTERGVHPDDG